MHLKIKRFFFLILFFWVPLNLFCQDNGLRYFKNYSRQEYSLHAQNWAILQSKQGLIYVGNHGGLLEFDGVSWRTIDIPNWSVRSMAKDDTGTIYIGGNNEIGFLAPDAKGTMKYVSLMNQLSQDEKNFSDVWKTYAAKEGIYFSTLKFLFRWDPRGKKMKVWKPEDSVYGAFLCGKKLFFRLGNVGLVQMKEDSLELVPGGEAFAAKKIYMMVQYDKRRLLIGTHTQGFYMYDGREARPFATGVDNYVKEKLLYRGIRLSSGDFAVATLRGGLVIMDPRGQLKEILDKTSGLQDNNVKYVFEDLQGNLWLGLNNGISKIEYSSPISFYERRSGLSGIVLSIVKYKNHLYAGTTSGLYALVSPLQFHPVPGITRNCYSLLSIKNSLLAATTIGVFHVESNGSRKIIEEPSYVLSHSQMDTNRIWVGIREGLISLYLNPKNKNQKGGWEKEYIFKDVVQTIRTIVEDKKGNLWLGTLAKGVIHVDFSANGLINPAVNVYGQSHGLPPREVHVFMAAGHVMFGTANGLYRFNETKKVFIPDSTLGDEFAGGKRNVFRLAEDRNKHIWFHSNTRNFQAIPQPDGSFALRSKPLLRIPPDQVNAIYPDPGRDITWFAGYDNLIRYDTAVKKNYRYDFPVVIRKVQVIGKYLVFDGHDICSGSKSLFPILPYKDRNLRFQCAASFFEGETMTRYRYFLEGYDDDWSDWTSESKKDYTNLDSDSYIFRVQAKNVYGHPGKEDIFKFKILPPWYKTWWAFVSYALVFFLLMFFIIKWRSWKLEREKQSLEQIVKERTKEVNQKNQQLEKQTVQLKDQSEKLKEMDRVKSQFFANISHEFRTPLTLIMGPLEQMLSGNRDETQKQQLNVMLRNSQRLLTLINQLLDLSRFDSGKMKLQASCQNIVPFLKGILGSFKQLAIQNKLGLEFSAENEDIILYFDSPKMEEVLYNLLINAVKFTPAGGKITVTVTRNPKKEKEFLAGFLEISVIDTGIGIPKDQLAHIFDRFYQARGSSVWEHNHKGTGIGLALTKEIVTLHHGKIDVHSTEGEGTHFVIRLPMGNEHLTPEEIGDFAVDTLSRKKPEKIPAFYMIEEKEKEKEDETTDTESETGMDKNEKDSEPGVPEKNTILVVEDNTEVRKYIRGPLESFYKVVEAVNGGEGIEIAKKIIPDLIISDIMMPEKDGYELCHTLKKDIKTSHIPIILLTAKASEESIIQGLETGADDYITKPFNSKILTVRIKNLIDLRHQLQLKIQRQKMLLPAEIQVSSIDQKFLKEFQGIIEKNLSDPDFNVDLLARKLYMGRTSLFRKVQALTGETPNQFVQSYRLERAAQLLKANFGNVTEVAFEVGFSSTAYFTKCFKEKFLQLPSTFQASEGQ